jgi:hypothetical protein
MERDLEIIELKEKIIQSSKVVDKLCDKVWELEQECKRYEEVLKGIGQTADNKGNHMKANNAIGTINMNGRGTVTVRRF